MGLGLKVQSTESFPKRMIMSHHHRPSSPPHSMMRVVGPTCDNNGANEVLLGSSSNIYLQDVTGAAVPPNVRAAIQHPFDISTTTTNTTTNNTASKSPGKVKAKAKTTYNIYI